MPCFIAPHAGYCAGVRKATETARAAAAEAAEKGIACYSLGQIIHNPDAVRELESIGIRTVDRVEQAESGIILLRSHGVSPSVIRECEGRGLIVRDCTCAFVSALHKIVSESPTPVILIGEADHPEVTGTAGWCKTACYIIREEAEIDVLPAIEEALVVSQTTFPVERWKALTEKLKKRIPVLTVRNTICPATETRQKEAVELAARMDAMVVVGGRMSANTRKLYELCRAACPKTILVERAAEIPPHFADTHTQNIGIAAGASTPGWLFKEVVTHMSDMEHVGQEVQMTMEAVDESLHRIRNGQTVTGKVIMITDDEIGVDLGYKSDGIIPVEELVDKDVKIGDEIEVEVVKVNDGDGNVQLSQKNIVNRKIWDDLMVKFENNEYIDATGKEAVKGGLLANIEGGVRAFIPASQLDTRYVEKIDKFVGQPMRIKIIDVDKTKKRIVASRRQVVEEERAAKKDAAWAKLEEGAVVTGIVRRFADFGAFVDLGGVDGLIHVTDIAWGRVSHPADVLKENQEVEVKILKLDRERDRIQLGYKQLQPKPWDNIEEKYPIGTVLERKVVRLASFGAFVELEPGVDGLVHISQCATTRVNKVEDVLQAGQMVKVKVLAVNAEEKRISLSIRDVLIDESPMDEVMEIPGEEAAAPEDAE